MLKENWTYKKLGEVATFVNGYPFKPDDWVETGVPIIRIQNLNNPDAVFNYYDGIIDSRYVVNDGDVLISWSGTLGVYEWTKKEKALLNQHIFKVVFDKTPINKGFFKYAVSSRINEMKSKVHGITMQHITKGEFDKTVIPVPPIEVQSRIVSELDLLQSLINKQQAQLKELDTLAQAIFYDMFGDPVENEKGWEVKTWNDIFETKTGKLNANAMVDGGKYPFFTCSKESFFIDEYAFDCEALLLAGNNASAKYDVKYYKGKFNAYQRTYVLTLKEGCYPFFKISLEQKLSLLQKQSIGGLTKYLTLGILEPIKFIFPPLSLQQSFAAKIESIEKQKSAINQSIAETQKLFDYTMDKYFG